MTDVVVVGAGISGAATAYELATAGLSVVVVDRWGPAAMASGWTLAGVRQSGRHPAELPLAQAAVADWETLDEKLGATTHYRQRGNLRLALTEAHLAQIAAMVAEQRAAGLELELLDRRGLRAVAPAVSESVLGASWCPTDGQADPHASVDAYLQAAARAGATFRFGEAAVAIEVAHGRVAAVRTDRGLLPCGRVVLATGVLGNALLQPLGLSVPIVPLAVTLLRTVPADPVLAPVIGVADASCAGRQEHDGRFRFTGAGEPYAGTLAFGSKPHLQPRVADVARVAALFGALVPAAVEAALDACWVGLIDQTPDALPVLERVAEPDGLVLAMGFSGHGFCLGPATGRICAALARDERPNLPIEAFRHGRFVQAPPPAALALHG